MCQLSKRRAHLKHIWEVSITKMGVEISEVLLQVVTKSKPRFKSGLANIFYRSKKGGLDKNGSLYPIGS
jgi:hypothetical protein